MRAGLVIIGEVAFEDAHEVRLIEHDHVIQTFTPDGSNQPFNIRRLPRRSKGDWNLLDAHAFDALAKITAVDRVSVTNHVFGRLIPRERLGNLLGRPCCRGMLRHVEMNDFAPIMTEHDKARQHPERRRGDSEEVNGHDILKMIVKESFPCLRWRLPVADHVLGDRALRNAAAQQLKLGQYPWGTQSGFSVDICLINWRISASIMDRPGFLLRERQRQYRRNPSRCHFTTVAGCRI